MSYLITHMDSSWKNYQFYIYVVLFAVGIVFLIITVNDLVTRNSAIIKAGLTLSTTGDWEYWIFAVSLVVAATFLYLTVKIAADTRKFELLVNGESKYTFVKNIRDLQKLANELGPRYGDQLNKAMEKWKVK